MFCCFCLNILNRHDCYSVSVSLEWNSTIWWRQVTVVRTWIHAQGQLRCSEALSHIQYNLHAFMVVNNYRNKRDFSLWNFLGKGYMPRKMLVSYMYFWGDKYINVINCNLSAHLVWGLLWANTSLNCHSSKFKILIFCCESHKDLSMSVLIIWWPYISTVLFTWWFSFMFTYHIPEHLIMCIGLVTRT